MTGEAAAGKPAVQRALDAVWRIESARIVATLAKMTGDVGLAEDIAQEALVDALTQWPGQACRPTRAPGSRP